MNYLTKYIKEKAFLVVDTPLVPNKKYMGKRNKERKKTNAASYHMKIA